MDYTHKRGDTFLRRNFEITVNGSAPTLTNVVMKLRREYGSAVMFEPSITITGTGEFCIDEQVINIQAFTYVYDIQIEYNGLKKTWISGNFTITDNATRSN